MTHEQPGRFTLDEFYDDYPRIEQQFQAELEASLDPRGPDVPYDVVAALQLPPGATVVDVGCGEGDHSVELARRFGFTVHGVDPVDRHIEVARAAARQLSEGVRGRVQFHSGTADAIPLDNDSAELIWCREVLYHVPDLHAALRELRRVLSSEGHVVIYQLFATKRLEPHEAEWLWNTTHVVPANAERAVMEQAIGASDLRIVENIQLGSETVEWGEERTGKAARELRSAARLLRDPHRYIDQFGPAAYDIKLADSLWHIYRMIGKLSNRIYILSP